MLVWTMSGNSVQVKTPLGESLRTYPKSFELLVPGLPTSKMSESTSERVR